VPGMIAKITVVRETCIGSGMCAYVAPGVFRLDAENVSTVIDPKGDSEPKILEAAEACPTLSIILEDAAGDRIFPREEDL